MRNIKFRGRKLHTEEWAYGDLSQQDPQYPRIYNWQEGSDNVVEKETVGQYTGLIDIHGKELYEGDAVRDVEQDLSVIQWEKDLVRFLLMPTDANSPRCILSSITTLEVVGNIYDNPELMKGE